MTQRNGTHDNIGMKLGNWDQKILNKNQIDKKRKNIERLEEHVHAWSFHLRIYWLSGMDLLVKIWNILRKKKKGNKKNSIKRKILIFYAVFSSISNVSKTGKTCS